MCIQHFPWAELLCLAVLMVNEEMSLFGSYPHSQGSMATWHQVWNLGNSKEGTIMDTQKHLRRGQVNWSIWKRHQLLIFFFYWKFLVSVSSLQEQWRKSCRIHLIIMCFSEKEITRLKHTSYCPFLTGTLELNDSSSGSIWSSDSKWIVSAEISSETVHTIKGSPSPAYYSDNDRRLWRQKAKQLSCSFLFESTSPQQQSFPVN